MGKKAVSVRKQYNATIYVDGMIKSGLKGKVDVTDLVIIDYIFKPWVNQKIKNMDVDEKGRIWVNYKTLIQWLPYIRINNKNSIGERIAKLKDLGVLHTSLQNLGYGRGSKMRIGFKKKFAKKYFLQREEGRELFLNFLAADKFKLQEKEIDEQQIDVTDLAIIAYLQYWIFYVKKRRTWEIVDHKNNKHTYVHIKYKELFEYIPCLRFKTKQSLITRLKKLERFNIIRRQTKHSTNGYQAYIRFTNKFRRKCILPNLYERIMKDDMTKEYVLNIADMVEGYDLTKPNDFFMLLERSFDIIKKRYKANYMTKLYKNVSVYSTNEKGIKIDRAIAKVIFRCLFGVACSEKMIFYKNDSSYTELIDDSFHLKQKQFEDHLKKHIDHFCFRIKRKRPTTGWDASIFKLSSWYSYGRDASIEAQEFAKRPKLERFTYY